MLTCLWRSERNGFKSESFGLVFAAEYGSKSSLDDAELLLFTLRELHSLNWNTKFMFGFRHDSSAVMLDAAFERRRLRRTWLFFVLEGSMFGEWLLLFRAESWLVCLSWRSWKCSEDVITDCFSESKRSAGGEIAFSCKTLFSTRGFLSSSSVSDDGWKWLLSESEERPFDFDKSIKKA